MKWMIFASAFIAVSLAPAYVQAQLPPVTGTCASIGYSTSCCPRGTNCQATDGNCRCSDDCHFSHNDDCCTDVGCPTNPRTCADVGFRHCCNLTSPRACEIRSGDGQQFVCACDMGCHRRGDCCSDARSTLCIPQTCADAGKAVGCCQWSPDTSCYVSTANCYCDSYCTVFRDCCSDVLPNHCPMPNAGVTSQSWLSQQARLQSALEQALTASQVNNYYNNRGGGGVNTEAYDTHHRMALAARTQRVRGNTARYNEFQRGRGRAQVAARPPGPPPYNYNY